MTVNGVAEGLYQIFGSVEANIEALFRYNIFARVDAGDPLVYDFANCVWPTDGSLSLTMLYAAFTYEGTLDFGTGDCDTAFLTIDGETSLVQLSELYD